MENVGCITIKEHFICKGSQYLSRIKLQSLCNLLVHEICHMWLGDLVSVVWWDDFWFKESFVGFMASFCISECFFDEFSNVWQEFCGFKNCGYNVERTSHASPVRGSVSDTGETGIRVDSVCYSKGPAVVKQLYFVVGKQIFQNACIKFINKYQHSNAQYSDFIEIIKQETDSIKPEIDIDKWTNDWILTAGLNILEPLPDPISGLSILQSSVLKHFDQLRSHSIYIEAYNSDFEIIKKQKALVQGAVTIIPELNDPQIKIIILNSDDWDYCSVKLDSTSLKHLKGNIWRIPNKINRSIVHRSLFDMVMNEEMNKKKYISRVSKEIFYEDDLSAFNFLLNSVHSVIFNCLSSPETICAWSHVVFCNLKEKILTGLEDDFLNTAFNHLVKFIVHKEDAYEAMSWVENDETAFNDYVLSNADIILIIKEYAAYDVSAVEKLNKFQDYFSKYLFELYQNFCRARIPDPDEKMKVWNSLMTNGEKMSRNQRKNIMIGFNDMRQKYILEPFASLYFDNLSIVALEKNREFVLDYVTQLFPKYIEKPLLYPPLKQALLSFPKEHSEAYQFLNHNLSQIPSQSHPNLT